MKFTRLLIFLKVLSVTTLIHSSAFAGPELPRLPSKVEFMRTVRAQWEALNSAVPSSLPKISVGQTKFLPIQDLIRGQDEISIDNIYAKLAEKISSGDVRWNAKKAHFELAYDSGKSSVSLKDPILVVRGKQGYVVMDGHHDLFLSLYLGADSIAVQVKEDLSDLKRVEFWETLKARRQVYLKESSEVLAKNPPPMTKVKDNPNRYLASLLALKIKAKSENGLTAIKKVKGSDAAVWVKVNDGLPFIEFYIAQEFTLAGISYDPSWGRQIPPNVVERCRKALLTAKSTNEALRSIPIIKSVRIAAQVREDALAAAKVISLVFPPRSLASPGCAVAFR